jgi:hypothetical protein
MRGLKPAFIALSLASTISLGGCFWSVGGGTQKVVKEHTAGEELTDLKRALDAGAVTPEEYEKLKKVYLSK